MFKQIIKIAFDSELGICLVYFLSENKQTNKKSLITTEPKGDQTKPPSGIEIGRMLNLR